MYSLAVKNATIKFYDQYGADMIAAITDTGLFLPAVLAQKALESGWGQSDLATKYNNFGGIKNFGSLANAGVVRMDTTEVVNGKTIKKPNEPFATFASPKIAFQAYVNVLKDPSKKYTSMGVFTADDPYDQILLMAKAGYTTTAPDKYLASMRSIIDAVLDIYKIGKISRTVKEPTVLQDNKAAVPSQATFMGSVNGFLTVFKTSLGL